MIRLITRVAAAVIAFGFAVDATYAIYNGAALNSANIMLDFVLGTMATLMGLFIPRFFSDDTTDELDIIDGDGLLDGVDEMSLMNRVPYVPKSPTAIVTIITPSPFNVVAHCCAFAACTCSRYPSSNSRRRMVVLGSWP